MDWGSLEQPIEISPCGWRYVDQPMAVSDSDVVDDFDERFSGFGRLGGG